MTLKVTLIVLFLFAAQLMLAQDLEQVGKGKAVQFNGSLSFRTGYYNSTLGYNRQDPYAYSLMGNAVLSLYGWQIPFTLSYANQQFNSSNPFQQFGMSPRYKWIRMHLGYSSMSFSPYTLNNHTFLGGGIELTPANFRFKVMYGRLREKQAKLDGKYSSFHIPAYKRMGYGVKLGYGSHENYIDLMLFKAEDDTTSLTSTDELNVLPSENLTVGLSTRLQLLKNLSWELEAAGSAYTRNMHSEAVDPGEIDLPNSLTTFFEPKLSSRFNFAGHTALNLQFQNFSIRGMYKRVQPEFQSMGVYYLTNDMEQYTISPTLRLFKGRLSLSASVGLEQDNLMGNKAVTTHRQIGSANLNWNTRGPFGLTMQYSNYQLNQNPALLDLNDTTKIAMVNSNLSVIPRLTFRKEKRTHQFTLFFNQQGLIDHNEFTSDNTETSTNTGNLNYSFRNSKSKFSLKSGINYTNMLTPVNEIIRYGLTVGLGQGFFDDKLRANLRSNYNRNVVDGEPAGYILGLHFNSSFKVKSGHAITLMFKISKNKTDNLRFSENMANLQYTYRFR